MKKKITKTIVNEYDKDGKIVKSTETTIEEHYEDTYKPIFPTTPINPYTQPYIKYENPNEYIWKITCNTSKEWR